MSKGPGKIQRAIIEAFEANPERAFYIEDLACLAHGDHVVKNVKEMVARSDPRLGLKVRAGCETYVDDGGATLRAARQVAKKLGWVSQRDNHNRVYYISPQRHAAEKAARDARNDVKIAAHEASKAAHEASKPSPKNVHIVRRSAPVQA